MPLIPTIGRQRQADLCEFKISLIYRVSSRTARTVTHKNPVSKNKKNSQAVVAHTFNSSTWEAEVCSTKWVPRQTGLFHRETLSREMKEERLCRKKKRLWSPRWPPTLRNSVSWVLRYWLPPCLASLQQTLGLLVRATAPHGAVYLFLLETRSVLKLLMDLPAHFLNPGIVDIYHHAWIPTCRHTKKCTHTFFL